MAYVKADIKTPDGRYHSTTRVDPNSKGGQGTKVDPKTGKRFQWINVFGKIITKWI